MTDARPSHSASRRGGHGGTGGTSMAARPAASPDCPPRSAERGTTAIAGVGTASLSPVVPLRRVPRGTAKTQQRRGVPPVPLCPPALQREVGANSRNALSHLSHLSHRVPLPSGRTVRTRAGMRDRRRVDVHAPFAGGVGVRPAGARAAAVPWRHVYASCSRDRNAPRPSWACGGRARGRKRAVRRNLSGLRANTRCGRVSTGSYGACRVGQWPEHRLVSIR
jgi:hypothetical protein